MDCQKVMEISHNFCSNEIDDVEKDSLILKLNDDCLRHIFSYLSFKDRIRIQRVCKKWQWLSKLPWTDVKQFFIRCASLDDYQIGNATNIPLPVLKQILGFCGLSVMHIKMAFYESNVSLIILKEIHEYCPNLLSLIVSRISLSQSVVEYLTCNYNRLTDISIASGESCYEDSLLRFFQSSTKLRSVGLMFSNNLTGHCLQGLSDTVEKLTIVDCSWLSAENLQKSLQRLNNLRCLNISDNRRKHHLSMHIDGILHILPNKSKLEELVLQSFRLQLNSDIFSQPIDYLHHFTNLRKISLGGNAVLFDEVLTIFGKYCVHITNASLSNSNKITDVGLQNFFKFLNIEILKVISLGGITDKFLAYLHKSSLKCLSCYDVPATNESLQSLMEDLENLKVLNVLHCKYVDTEKLEKDAVAVNNHRPHNRTIRLFYVDVQKASTL